MAASACLLSDSVSNVTRRVSVFVQADSTGTVECAQAWVVCFCSFITCPTLHVSRTFYLYAFFFLFFLHSHAQLQGATIACWLQPRQNSMSVAADPTQFSFSASVISGSAVLGVLSGITPAVSPSTRFNFTYTASNASVGVIQVC